MTLDLLAWSGILGGIVAFFAFVLSFILIVLILFQESKDSGLSGAFGGGGGGNAFFGASMQKDLAKLTAYCAVILAGCLVILGIMASRQSMESYADDASAAAPAAATGAAPAATETGGAPGTAEKAEASDGQPLPGAGGPIQINVEPTTPSGAASPAAAPSASPPEGASGPTPAGDGSPPAGGTPAPSSEGPTSPGGSDGQGS